jgi:HAD superfamily hydrolase (TIGR01509 family)
MKYKAFLFDLNGTMIDDMSYHVKAWHRILNEHGANISMERARAECYGKNQELIERVLPGKFTMDEKDRMSIEKETQYQEEFGPHLKLLDGLNLFLQQSHARGIRMAIGTAAILYNIDFVIDNLGIRKYFDVIVGAEDVNRSKPDPETYIKCASALEIDPSGCLVFEDTPKGVETARCAGMDCVVITTLHTEAEFAGFDNIIAFISDYNKFELL